MRKTKYYLVKCVFNFLQEIWVREDYGGGVFYFLFFTVVVDYINKMKTTFGYNFDFNQALKQHGYTKTWKQREVVN